MVESQRGVVDVLQIGAHVGDSRASSAEHTHAARSSRSRLRFDSRHRAIAASPAGPWALPLRSSDWMLRFTAMAAHSTCSPCTLPRHAIAAACR